MKKKVTSRLVMFVLSMLTLIGLSLSPYPMKKERVKIGIADQEVTIYSYQEAWTGSGVISCTPGLTLDWMNSLRIQVTLSYGDEIVQKYEIDRNPSKWGDIAPAYYPDYSVEKCVWPARDTYASYWAVDKLKLNKYGDYVLHFNFFLMDPLIDGYDLNSDGFADWYDVGIRQDRQVLIHYQK